MLTNSTPKRHHTLSQASRRGAQQGIVLFIVLVVLVVMALATAAMLRSVSSTTGITGNLAFQQAAVTSSDRGVETAVAWLETNNGASSSSSASACSSGSSVLACDQTSHGYLATRTDPTTSQTWADVWDSLSSSVTPISLGDDAAGNDVSYLIQRMCSATGDAATGTCSEAPSSSECGQSHSSNSSGIGCTSQVYYRITVKTTGPHNTVSFTQAMVAL
jgi:type IV pilus assembly protein PilX